MKDQADYLRILHFTVVIDRILAKHDALGLIESGCSSDEYGDLCRPVIEILLKKPNTTELQKNIEELFRESFGNCIVESVPADLWPALAKDLQEVWDKHMKEHG